VRLEQESQIEQFQVVKYRPGEFYRVHQDFFIPREAAEYRSWFEWLENKLRSNNPEDIKAIDQADPRLHTSSGHFNRAIYDLLVAEKMLNDQDIGWLAGASDAQDFERRWQHVIQVSPIARLARRAFATTVRRPELVMPEVPMAQNRLATLFVYLNDDYEGGATAFSNANSTPLAPTLPELTQDKYTFHECQVGTQVRGRPGDAVLFYNLRADDAVEPRSVHSACPPFSGIKYGANVWIQTGAPGSPTGEWKGEL
jgi:hypothetical protein